MKLILLHGPPAAGKLTTAKKISDFSSAKIIHNHLIVDISLSVYDNFGQDDFFSFNNSIRLMVLNKSYELKTNLVVMTYCYSYPHDNSYLDEILSFCSEKNIIIYPVHLNPEESILLERVKDKKRKDSNKVSDPGLLKELLNSRSYNAINHENTVIIDNSRISAAEAANIILDSIK